jgi:hypothetical protein
MTNLKGSDRYETAKTALQVANQLRLNGMIVRVIGEREGEFGMSFLRFLAHAEVGRN